MKSRSPEKAAVPLLGALERYDALRLRLETEGGRVADLQELTELLETEIEVAHTRVRLTEPGSLRRLGVLAGLPGLHVEVRTTAWGMPLYHVCRTAWAAWHSGPDVVVQDLYTSPGYPRPRGGLIKLMDLGQPRLFLHLGPFRAGVEDDLVAAGELADWRGVDARLTSVGTHVLQAAWHEDQHLAIVVGELFDVPLLRQAVETLYVLLQADLCDLRARVSPRLISFFRGVYPQAGIAAVLAALPAIDGERLEAWPAAAERAYRELSSAFAAFLRTEVAWRGTGGVRSPLFKLLLANVDRLESVLPLLESSATLDQARSRLAQQAAWALDAALAAAPAARAA